MPPMIPQNSSRVKILYIESIKDPDRLLKHSSSLIRKGCRIAAIKSGGSEAGSRAASSHTGAIASSDLAVEALFRKAGIVRCFGREELSTVACDLHASRSDRATDRHHHPCRRTRRDAHRRPVVGRTEDPAHRGPCSRRVTGRTCTVAPPYRIPSTSSPPAPPGSWEW